ncbi:unnamed protein product [Brassica oleracea var. botrytis]|uniref:Uncharacterized protein n=1 Tax=Brassica oleracea TaxID=3712 RepID=A0A3P6ARV5_BRAOL|nr:unnamed protein product [Brassica oleracea]
MFGSSTIGKSRPPMSTTGEADECSTASTAFEGTLTSSTTTPGFGSSKLEVSTIFCSTLGETGWTLPTAGVPHFDSFIIGDRGFGLLTFGLTASPPSSYVVDATGTTQSGLVPEVAGSVAAAFIPELYR